MTKSLHQLSGIFFYVLGTTFFVAYLLLRNDVVAPWPVWWLRIADLPLVLVAMFYGGTSLYLSVKPAEGPARLQPLAIAVPLGLLFGLLVVLNFWEIIAR